MLGFLIAGTALAGSVFVNGVNVDALRNQTFKNVTSVTLDAEGNVVIDAPGYEIQVVGTQGGVPPAENTTTPDSPPMDAPPVGDPAVPISRWWLVTEDNASSGHVISIYLNGVLVRSLPSGQPQLIEDLAAYLHPGDNQVRVESSSTAPSGGTFYVYLGSGNNDSGTVVMDTPQVQFGVGPAREGPYLREYTLKVP